MEEDSNIPDFCLARVAAWMQAKEHERRRTQQERDQAQARRHQLPPVPVAASSVPKAVAQRPATGIHEDPQNAAVCGAGFLKPRNSVNSRLRSP
ncbi:hypothetical protein WJX84_011217 [Apatococcus fuscideae]|uniref:Uncharacterized protein n=1 Tax=Apatococcus fuscideae TaxID=2026836 RepID=A0AAW1ST55_9CHLO